MKKSSFVPLLIVSIILLVFAVLRFIPKEQEPKFPPTPPELSPISETKTVKDAPPIMVAAAKAPTEGIIAEPDSAKKNENEDVVSFRKITAKLARELPTVEQIRKEKGDTHETPQTLLQAGDGQAKVIEALRANPRLIAEGVDFFRDCAEKDGVMPALRAVCLRNFRVWAKRGNYSNTLKVPEYISNLANGLPAE